MEWRIIHHKDAYNIWCSSTLAPIFNYALTEDELRKVCPYDHSIQMAQEKGVSDKSLTLEELIRGNRAGYRDSELTLDEIIETYLTLKQNESEVKNWFCCKCHRVIKGNLSSASCCGDLELLDAKKHLETLINNSNAWIDQSWIS